MKNRTLLYIPLVFLFALAATVLTMQASRVFPELSRLVRADLTRSPFMMRDGGAVTILRPEGEAAGIKLGDRVTAINGRELAASEETFIEEFEKAGIGDAVNYTIERKTENGAAERQVIGVPAARRSFTLAARFGIRRRFDF